MRTQLTLAHAGARCDVEVQAPPTTALADVLPDLAAAVGAGPDVPVWRGDTLLAPATAFGAAGLTLGSVLSFGQRPPRPPRRAVLSLQVVGGPSAGATVPLERGTLCIGRGAECDLTLSDDAVSRRHALVVVGSAGIAIRDLDSTNGTCVGGARLTAEAPLRLGDLIRLGDSVLSVVGPLDPPVAVRRGEHGTALLLPPPRRHHQVSEREIVAPVPSHPLRPVGTRLLTALLPAVAAGALAWLADAPQFLLFALLSPAVLVATSLGDRWHWRRSRRRDAAQFRSRRAEVDREISAVLAAEATARRSAAPDPALLGAQAALPGVRVWERRRSDADLLQVRLGLAELPATLRVRTGSTSRSAATLDCVPLVVDLRHGPLGSTGPPDVRTSLARWLVGQLAVLHSPADVELAMLLGADRGDAWAWARWLPHLRGRVGVGPAECAAVVGDLTRLISSRERLGGIDRWRGPWLVVVVDAGDEVPGLPGLLADGPAVGVTAVWLAADLTGLPATCHTVAQARSGTRLGVLAAGEPVETDVVVDQVGTEWAEGVARDLAGLVDGSGDGSAAVPDRCRLLELLGDVSADAVRRGWERSTGGADTVLGRTAEGLLEVDLARDGPHALIAGTTGAGKSELLQSLVAGLATRHPPDELNVLLIDYKGGAAFADCAALPHTAGLVTDLDPYLTERALRALHSELRRREELFAAAGASDLRAYRDSAPDVPVPRLVILVDEFAALADELPEFVRGLVGVAARGRSLGVHLVLATQRPGSSVSAEIKANTSLRVALRVTDPAESADVVGCPDAAAIARATPGRAYLRAGPSMTCFQSGQASATGSLVPDRVTVEPLGAWRRPMRAGPPPDGETDLRRVVDAICAAARAAGRPAARSPWVAPLPASIPAATLADAGDPGAVCIGLVDLPDQQRRESLTVSVDPPGSVLIAGSARSGRTQSLVTLALAAASSRSPAGLHVHVADAGGDLAPLIGALPHCATVLGPDDLALVPRLLHRLQAEVACRAAARADGRAPDDSLLLLLIDGWDEISARLPDLDAAISAGLLAALVRTGPTAGVLVAATGDRSLLIPRLASGFAERLVLQMSDRSDYAMAGIPPAAVPPTLPPGRGLRAGDAALVQLALAGAGPGPDAALARVAEVARHWTAAAEPLGPQAIRIRPLPSRVALADLPASPERLTLGLAGDEGVPAVIDPFAGSARLLIAGPPRSGRTTALISLAVQAGAAGLATLVAAPPRSALTACARELALPCIDPGTRPAARPPGRTLLLVDDSEAFIESPAGDRLTEWLQDSTGQLAVVAAGRPDDLATSYRGVGAAVRRSRCGILLRPGPVDGELLGVRLPRRTTADPPGRGVAVGEPSWGPLFDSGEPVPIQLAMP